MTWNDAGTEVTLTTEEWAVYTAAHQRAVTARNAAVERANTADRLLAESIKNDVMPLHLSTGHIEDGLRVVHQPTKLPAFTLERWDSDDAIMADYWRTCTCGIQASQGHSTHACDDGELVKDAVLTHVMTES